MRVLYHRRCGPSGRRLADALADIESDLTLNWGLSTAGNGLWINDPSSVAVASDKLAALQVMAGFKHHVPTPQFTDDPDVAVSWLTSGHLVIGRTAHHRGGSGLSAISSPSGVEWSRRQGATHWLKRVDAIHEYRVHVVAGKVIKTSEKLGGAGWVRAKANGWTFRSPTTTFEERAPVRLAARRAVRSLGLDFGAVDVLVDRDGGVYTLEVNTAPSVADPTSTTFDRYVEAITAIATGGREGEDDGPPA